MPAVTTTRSWLAKVDRASDAAVTVTLGRSEPPCTATGVSTAPGGSDVPSAPCQPVRWKSLINTTSRRGSSESASRLSGHLDCRRVAGGSLRRAWPRPPRRRARSLRPWTAGRCRLQRRTAPPTRGRSRRDRAAHPAAADCARRPAVAVAHAVADVQQHDQLARALADRHRRVGTRQQRPGERGDDERRAPPAGCQQEPVLELPPADRLSTGSAARTSATGSRRSASSRAGSGAAGPESPGRPAQPGTVGREKTSMALLVTVSSSTASDRSGSGTARGPAVATCRACV